MNLYDIVKTKLVCENRMEHRDTKAQSYRSEKDQKIAQSTHENEYIKPRKTFWRNSKQLLNFSVSLITPDYKSGVTRLALIR